MFASASTTLPIDEMWQDGPAMFTRPARPRFDRKPRKPVSNIGLGFPFDAEIYRARTQPELYPDWLVQDLHTHRSAYVESLGMNVFDWDCTSCQRAVITSAAQGERCPCCGAAPVYNRTTGARL